MESHQIKELVAWNRIELKYTDSKDILISNIDGNLETSYYGTKGGTAQFSNSAQCVLITKGGSGTILWTYSNIIGVTLK